MNHSPARVLFELCKALETFEGVSDFVGFVSNTPSEPDNCITFYDTLPVPDGRSMRSGALFEHPGVQIRVRAEDYNAGWRKMREVQAIMEGLFQDTIVVVDAEEEDWIYTIQNASLQGGILPLGRETPAESTKARNLFTLNVALTIKGEALTP